MISKNGVNPIKSKVVNVLVQLERFLLQLFFQVVSTHMIFSYILSDQNTILHCFLIFPSGFEPNTLLLYYLYYLFRLVVKIYIPIDKKKKKKNYFFTINKKGQYRLHNIDAVKKPQSLKPYEQSSISKIILHFHFSLPILLDAVFDLLIKAEILLQYIISNILILYSFKHLSIGIICGLILYHSREINSVSKVF